MAKTASHTEETKKNIAVAKAAEGLKKEATGQVADPIEVTVEVQGEDMVFTVPGSIEDAPADVLFYMEDEKPMKAFRTLLGEEEYNRMRAAKATGRDFTRFIEIWVEEVGLGK